jgi:hypothetical protein
MSYSLKDTFFFLFLLSFSYFFFFFPRFIYCYAKYHYAECHSAECRYAGCRYAECRGAFLNFKFEGSTPEAGSLNKCSCLAPALGVTKFKTTRDVILVTLRCAT